MMKTFSKQKTNYLILFFFGLGNIGAEAQFREIKKTYYDSYSDNLQRWVNQEVPHYYVRYYDEAKKLVKELWASSEKDDGYRSLGGITIYEYDTKGREIEKKMSYALYNVRNNQTIKRTFNDIDSLAEYSIWHQDDSLKTFYKQSAMQYRYDSQKRIAEELKIFLFDYPTNTTLTDLNKNSYFYDSNGRLFRTQVDYIEKGIIVATFKTDFEFDASGNKIVAVKSQFNKTQNEWLNTEKIEYAYDSRNNLISIVVSVALSQISWDYSSKQLMTYDNQNRLISTQYYKYNSKTRQFFYQSEQTQKYNQDGLITEEKRVNNLFDEESINPREGTIVYTISNTYDDRKRLKEEIHHSEEIAPQQFRKSLSRYRYEYETTESTDESTYFERYLIFPNPTTRHITIDNTLEGECLISASLCDMTGRVLVEFSKSSPSFGYYAQCRWQLELSDQIPSGIYLIRMVNLQGKTITKKIVVQR